MSYRMAERNGERWIVKDIAEGRVELVEMWSPQARLAALASRKRDEMEAGKGMMRNEYTVRQHAGQLGDEDPHFSVHHPSMGSVSSHATREEAEMEADRLNKQHSLGKYADKVTYVKKGTAPVINHAQWNRQAA